jgi:hypothetical protein
MTTKKTPPAVTEYFRQLGKKYGSKAGKIGGKRSLKTMTPAARTTRAKLAAAASAKVRAKKAKKK